MLFQSPLFSFDGANWATTDMTCLPVGASDGSVTVGIVTSQYGCGEKSPYLAASNARSR